MKKPQLKLAFVLFILGFTGVLSLLQSDLLANLPKEGLEVLLQQLSETEVKLLTLSSPTLMLIVCILIGTLTYKKVLLTVPTIESLIAKKPWKTIFKQQVKFGIFGGVIAGLLIVITSYLFIPFLPQEFLALQEKSELAIITRFLYGGITEEILVRFGILSLIAWIGSKIIGKTTNGVYWVAILLAAIIFGLGHFPIVFNLVENPTTLLLFFILFANALGGLVFGWLYWKKGLESAIIAHIVTHIIMLCLA